jgi:hypothetical protein
MGPIWPVSPFILLHPQVENPGKKPADIVTETARLICSAIMPPNGQRAISIWLPRLANYDTSMHNQSMSFKCMCVWTWTLETRRSNDHNDRSGSDYAVDTQESNAFRRVYSELATPKDVSQFRFLPWWNAWCSVYEKLTENLGIWQSDVIKR